MNHDISLAGDWQLERLNEKNFDQILHFPGTLDTNGIGEPDEPAMRYRLTRMHVFEGTAVFSKNVHLTAAELQNQRVFLEIERARFLKLKVNGKPVKSDRAQTLSTVHVFEVTQDLQAGENQILLMSDNHYDSAGWPRFGLLNSSAATDQTQTNWNGLLGTIKLRFEAQTFIESARVYPEKNGLSVELDINSALDYEGQLKLSSETLIEDFRQKVKISANQLRTFRFSQLVLKDHLQSWDEFEGNLYHLKAELSGLAAKEVTFGLRKIAVNEKLRLTLNNRVFFLRGEANCGLFPESGHPPMTQAGWEEILGAYAAYGVNLVRFHSWCPPEAAFSAADKLGMMLQPELSHWDPEKAFEEKSSFDYYRNELREILHDLANHPSFVMLTFGNELWAEEAGHKRMDELLLMAKTLDPTRLYANSSNPHYGLRATDKWSDFYTSHDIYPDGETRLTLRASSTVDNGRNFGHIYTDYPNSKTDYNAAVEAVQREGKPVFSFEVGQYEILPDFKEIPDFRGVTRAVNLELMKEAAKKQGLLENWESLVEATGELAFLGYREEIEAALRTEGLSGLSLLGLQDFTGQGTALIGMMNSHLQPKPYSFANPERFRKYFNDVLPLIYTEKYCFSNKEKLFASFKLANYGKSPIAAEAHWQLKRSQETLQQGSFSLLNFPMGQLSDIGQVELELDAITKASRLDLEISLGNYSNVNPVWVYPELVWTEDSRAAEEFIYEGKVLVARRLSPKVLDFLNSGGMVYLEPEATEAAIPNSIQSQFGCDFWSVGTFPDQAGGMSLLPNPSHPALKEFPSENHCNWQWWLMASGHAMILPDEIEPILAVPDSALKMRHLGLLIEGKCLNGSIMLSGMGLRDHLDKPECSELLYDLLDYLKHGALKNTQIIKTDFINRLLEKE